MKISSIAAPLALASLVLAGCSTTPEGAFAVGTSTGLIDIAPEAPLDIERTDYPMPAGMKPATLYIGQLEVLVSDQTLGRLGIGKKAVMEQLEANLRTALTRFDHVAGVVDADDVSKKSWGREAPMRVSAAVMDLRFDAREQHRRQQDGDMPQATEDSQEPRTVEHGFLECRVRLTLQMRTQDGLMEFAAQQCLGRKKVELEVPIRWTPGTVPPAEVKDHLPNTLLLGLLGSMAQSLPNLEQLWSEEIEAAKGKKRASSSFGSED